MTYNYENLDRVDDADPFDPFWIERRAFTDNEAESIKTLCQSATPGPLVADHETDIDGAIVATMPDGRHIVSLSTPVQRTHDAMAIEANTQLICKARDFLLRLLHDRQHWKQQQEFLEQRIRTLDTALYSERSSGIPSEQHQHSTEAQAFIP